MNTAQLKCYIEEDGGRCILEVARAGQSLLHLRLDAAGLDAAIERLVAARAALALPVAPEPDPELIATPNPRWRIPAETQHDGRVLAIRHPGLGWLAFLIPPAEAVQMARWLIHRPGAPDP